MDQSGGRIAVTASGTFRTFNIWTHDTPDSHIFSHGVSRGLFRIYIDGSARGQSDTFVEESGELTIELIPCGYSSGPHPLKVEAVDFPVIGDVEPKIATATQDIENNLTPEVTVLEPQGTIAQPFDLRAQVQFQPDAFVEDGKIVSLFVDNRHYSAHHTDLEGTVEVSHEGLTGQRIDPRSLEEGTHIFKVIAISCGGRAQKEVTESFEIRHELKLEMGDPSGDGQEGPINTTLPEPLKVKVTDGSGENVSGVAIEWSISGPDGAMGQKVNGNLEAVVTLGDKAGDYQVTATCPECTDGSPQTFTVIATSDKILSSVSGRVC